MSYDLPENDRLDGVNSEDERAAMSVPRLSKYRALLLNVDYRPARLYPLSTVPWTTLMTWIIKSMDRAKHNPKANPCCVVLEHYPDVFVNGAQHRIQLPSVVRYPFFVKRLNRVAFTRSNVLLRDNFTCQYTGQKLPRNKLTIDHVIPRSRGGTNTWENVVACEMGLNFNKRDRTPQEAGLRLRRIPVKPTTEEINRISKMYLKADMTNLNPAWMDYLETYLN